MENSTTVAVLGKGNIKLEFTSRKTLTITNVYYVPKVRKNLLSNGLLNKFVLSKGCVFVGKGFYCDGMFKLNTMNKTINFVYIVVNSLYLWHSHLGHVNNIRLHDISVLELIPN